MPIGKVASLPDESDIKLLLFDKDSLEIFLPDQQLPWSGARFALGPSERNFYSEEVSNGVISFWNVIQPNFFNKEASSVILFSKYWYQSKLWLKGQNSVKFPCPAWNLQALVQYTVIFVTWRPLKKGHAPCFLWPRVITLKNCMVYSSSPETS